MIEKAGSFDLVPREGVNSDNSFAEGSDRLRDFAVASEVAFLRGRIVHWSWTGRSESGRSVRRGRRVA